MTQVSYRASQERIGQLDCITIQPQVAPRAVAVLCHGFGAPGDDLVGLAPDLLEARSSTAPVELIFPAGPLSLAAEGFPEGRAWWALSIQRLLAMMEQGQYELIREESPDGIEAARDALCEVIETALARRGLTSQHLLLGGFSQGAMLAMECACCGLAQPPAALALYSGCLIREPHWRVAAARLAGTRILQSHGELDPILPLRTGRWLYDLLLAHHCPVDFHQFAGPHTIPWEAIEGTAQLLDGLADDSRFTA